MSLWKEGPTSVCRCRHSKRKIAMAAVVPSLLPWSSTSFQLPAQPESLHRWSRRPSLALDVSQSHHGTEVTKRNGKTLSSCKSGTIQGSTCYSDRNTTVSLLSFWPTSAAQGYGRLCQTSIWALVLGLQLCFFLLVGTQRHHPFTAGACFFPVGAAGSRSATHTHPSLGCKCPGSGNSRVQPERSPPVFTAIAFARCITLSLADKCQLGGSCSLTTEMGPISLKRAIRWQSCYFLYLCISSIHFIFPAKH